MNSEIDLRSVYSRFKFNCPTIENPSSLNAVRLQKQLISVNIFVQLPELILHRFHAQSFVRLWICIFTLITLVIGASNISACPVEQRVPIYLVVSATINLAQCSYLPSLSDIFGSYERKRREYYWIFLCYRFHAIMIIIFQLVNFIWLIAWNCLDI